MAQSITLQTSDNDIVVGDVLGRLSFAASSETSGADALLVSASIYAEAESTFTAISNATSLVFATSNSEEAIAKLKLTSQGSLVPIIDNTYDIGSSSFGFRNVYVSSGLYSSQIYLGSGSSSAPAIVPSGDTNTGFWFPAADTLAFSTNGIERMRVHANGNIFIGSETSSSPTSLNKGIYLTHSSGVVGNSLYTNDGARNRRVNFFLDDTNGIYGFNATASASASIPQFVIQNAGTTRLSLNNLDGRIWAGLGTAAPVTGNAWVGLGCGSGITIFPSTRKFLQSGVISSASVLYQQQQLTNVIGLSQIASFTGILALQIPRISTAGSQITIRGNSYDSGDTPSWSLSYTFYGTTNFSGRSKSLMVAGSPPFSRVRLMQDGVNTDRLYLFLGDTTTVHAGTTQYNVDFCGLHVTSTAPNMTLFDWLSLTSETGYSLFSANNDLTISNVMPSIGNVGIGTTSPSVRLHVDGSGIFSSGLKISNQTASTLAGFDSSSNVVSLSTATYPSLTELSYVKGTTSALQTQLDNKSSISHTHGNISSSGTIGNASNLPIITTTNGVLTTGLFTLPSSVGSSGQILTTNGVGSTSWQNVSANTVRGSVAATGNQSVFPVAGGFVSGNIDVFLNGIKLLSGTDFSQDGNNITLTSAATVGDVLEYNAYGLVVASNGLQKTGDTMTGNLTVSSGNQIIFNSSIIDDNSLDISVCNGRLTLESGVAVSTTDQTAKTTLYFTPYNGNRICLYNSTLSKWKMYSFNELSLSLSGLAANTNYDIYVYDNNGTLTLESVAWTNDTTRNIALATQNSIYMRTGSLNKRYLGTIRTTGTIGQCEDSASSRFVWNMYNRTVRPLRGSLISAVHTYTSSTTRAWNTNTTVGQGRVLFILGLADNINGGFMCSQSNAASSSLGLDSTTGGISDTLLMLNQNASAIRGSAFSMIDNVSIGYHYLQLCENSSNGTSGSYVSAKLDSQINC